MNTLELAEEIAMQLSNRKVRIERDSVLGDSQYGINTEFMLIVRVYFPLTYANQDIFQVAQSLFPREEGKDLSLRGSGKNRELEVRMYFPLPYPSAERFPSAERGKFVEDMALFKISTVVRGLLGGHRRNILAAAIPDPRHPDEIKWEKIKDAVLVFLQRLLPKRKKVPKRRFQEYL